MSITNHYSTLLLLTGLLTACSSLRQRDDITQLNQVFRIPRGQNMYAYSKRGGVVVKTIKKSVNAALYEQQDTLFAEFLAESLPQPDGDPNTLDQSDSLALFFVHYNPTLKKIEEKSPWFRYQDTAFDLDLFTLPLKYRFATAGQPGQLDDKLNVGIHAGYRYDLGRYRTVYFRHHQRSEITSFSIGFGGFLCFAPATVTSFSTAGRVQDDYQALGINYGVATTLSYGSVSAGLALGVERLSNHDRILWIYENKPWIGVTVGINLN
ncbi:hypothetical protein [Spirosoma flavum]|uniref:Lipoprotein n=1 Tax=Spirosoma flavum TaxID=2048557 RepID=A0ABW6AQT7_9BACT